MRRGVIEINIHIDDLYDQDLPPRALGMIGSKTGIVKYVTTYLIERGDPQVFVSSPTVSDIARISPGDEQEISLSASGKGVSERDSLMSSVGEVAERYCAYFPNYNEMLKDSYAGLKSRGLNVVDFEYLDMYDSSQYRKLADLTRWEGPLQRDSMTWWCKGRNLLTGEKTHVPAQLVYLERNRRDQIYFLGTSNGMASGDTRRSALVRSIYECVERDAIMLTWYTHESPSQIDVGGISRIAEMKRNLENDFVTYTVLEFDTGLDFHTLGCAMVDEQEKSPKFLLAGGASLNASSAMVKALIEAAQGAIYLNDLISDFDGRDIAVDEATDFESNVAYYARAENFGEVEFLLDGNTKEIRETEPVEQNELRRSIDVMKNAGLTPIAFNLTTRDLRETGLHVTKVFVPELVSLHLPAFPPKNHPRFLEHDIVDKPHPFP